MHVEPRRLPVSHIRRRLLLLLTLILCESASSVNLIGIPSIEIDGTVAVSGAAVADGFLAVSREHVHGAQRTSAQTPGDVGRDAARRFSLALWSSRWERVKLLTDVPLARTELLILRVVSLDDLPRVHLTIVAVTRRLVVSLVVIQRPGVSAIVCVSLLGIVMMLLQNKKTVRTFYN